MNNFINHKQLLKYILKSAYGIHKNLGYGFSREAYINALCVELVMRGLNIEKQKNVDIRYKGNVIGKHTIDIVVEDKIIIQVNDGAKVHKGQLLNYLDAAGMDAGLVISFSKPKLEFKRVMVQALMRR